MKRMIHALLAAAVLVSAMTCTVFAGDYTMDKTDDAAKYVGSVTTTDNGKSYTVSYDKATPDNQYALLIVKLEANGTYDASKAENILYINQDGAASDKTITFEGLIPMTSANAIVLLGGVFDGEESPVILGELKVPYILGDINSDTFVLADDAYMALQASVGNMELDATQALAADVNLDTFVLADDAYMILQYSVGNITEF